MESDTFYREAHDAVEDVYYQRNQLSNRRQQDLTEVEEEVEATEREFRKDTRIQLILMVTFPDIEFVNPSIIGKTIALITPTEIQR